MKCDNCGAQFESSRSDKKTCSAKCRMALSRSLIPKSIQTITEVETALKKLRAKKSPSASEDRKPLFNGISGEPRFHSGWYWRTDLHRRQLIDDIKAGDAQGTVEKHPVYGNVITRTTEQAQGYDSGHVGGGDWAAKFEGEWLTAADALARAIDVGSRYKEQLYT
jgi:hypothetical protein